MSDLILLNGPPASGKSTLAAALATSRPGTSVVDVDVLRGEIEAWADDPIAAGLVARRRAIVMLGDQLEDGNDVVVPQLLVRDEFLLELERAAHEHGARFVEIALAMPRVDAIAAFERRSAAPATAVHADAAMIVERGGGRSELERIYDAYIGFVDRRSGAIRIPVSIGDVPTTVARIESAIGWEAGTMEA